MAIKDISRKPYIQDNDTNVKVGIDLPIRRGDDLDGFFASTSTTIEAVKNNLRNLLQTEEGERFFQPNLGLNLKAVLFEQINEENLLSIQNKILDKIDFWLPFIEIHDIELLTTDKEPSIKTNEIRVKILFNLKQDPNTLDSVSINFTSNVTGDNTTTAGGGY